MTQKEGAALLRRVATDVDALAKTLESGYQWNIETHGLKLKAVCHMLMVLSLSTISDDPEKT